VSDDGSYEALVVCTGSAAGAAETAVIRLVAGLPPGWDCDEQVGEDGIRLRVRPPRGTAPGAARAWLTRALADSALAGWHESAADLPPGTAAAVLPGAAGAVPCGRSAAPPPGCSGDPPPWPPGSAAVPGPRGC
jgi:hypothetical protein